MTKQVNTVHTDFEKWLESEIKLIAERAWQAANDKYVDQITTFQILNDNLKMSNMHLAQELEAIKSIHPNIDAKDKEIEALRAFAGDILYVFSKEALTPKILIDIAMELKIINEHGHPTKLLTGAKDE